MLTSRAFIADIEKKFEHLNVDKNLKLSADEIERAVATVYFSSIRLEEGEKVLPSILVGKDEKVLLEKRQFPFLRWEPTDLTPEVLRKLSLAFERTKSTFFAVPREGRLVLIGVAHEDWKGNDIASLARSTASLAIGALDVGTVAVSIGLARLGVFRDGNFYAARQDIFKNLSFRNAISRGTLEEFNALTKPFDSSLTALRHLVLHACKMKRGGTIVVLKTVDKAEAQKHIETARDVCYEPQLTPQGSVPLNYQYEVQDTQYEQRDASSLSESRKQFLEFVATLSGVDGALVVNERLQPIFMGAKLSAPKYAGPILLGGDQNNVISPRTGEVGTRHTSAIHFVGKVARATAFVISSDGPVSVLCNTGSGIGWWKNAVDY